jgi:parallel beta-helix repeat protein
MSSLVFMKMRILSIMAAGVCGCVLTAPSGFSQGALTPPGPPAPTMLSLAQIEPRTPVSVAGAILNTPGSYYLTTNILGASGANGITISSGNVTLDLNGFTVQGTPGSLNGVYVSGGFTNIIVRNGIITGWTGGSGVMWNYPNLPLPQNIVLENLTVSANGVGIYTADGGMVSHCRVQNNYQAGILVKGSYSRIVGNTLVGNNAANSASGASIGIGGSFNRVEDNYITGSGPAGYGITYFTIGCTNNTVVRNSVQGGGAYNYSVGFGVPNDVGPIGTAAASSSPWANISD